MRKRWDDYAGAAERLAAAEGESPTLMRKQAQDITGMSPAVFGREVLANPMWIARNTEDVHPGATYFRTADLVRHFERMRDKRECARLLYDYFYLSDQAFLDEYGKPKEVVFAPGTTLTVTVDGEELVAR